MLIVSRGLYTKRLKNVIRIYKYNNILVYILQNINCFLSLNLWGAHCQFHFSPKTWVMYPTAIVCKGKTTTDVLDVWVHIGNLPTYIRCWSSSTSLGATFSSTFISFYKQGGPSMYCISQMQSYKAFIQYNETHLTHIIERVLLRQHAGYSRFSFCCVTIRRLIGSNGEGNSASETSCLPSFCTGELATHSLLLLTKSSYNRLTLSRDW